MTTNNDTANNDTDIATELLERAQDLALILRERAGDTAQQRRLPAETIADLRHTGLLKVLQAKRSGGYQLGMREHLDVVAALARGCGSTSWVVGVTHAHSWMMSHFPEQAQDETYGADPDTFISAVIAPRGRAVRTESGYRVSGVWPFASGSENADWLFLGAAVFEGDSEEPIDEGEFLVPSSAVTYRDDWHVTGLAGTGSCTVELHDVEVPTHRYLSMAAIVTAQSPGAELHEGWTHRFAGVPVLVLALAGSALGMARQALEDFPTVIGEKSIAYTEYVQRDHTTTHLTMATATAKVDQAEFHLYRAADGMDETAKAGGFPEDLHRAQMRSDAAEAVKLCLNAVEMVWKATGGSGLYKTNPLGLALANLQAMSVHGALNSETASELHGRMLMGLGPDTPLL